MKNITILILIIASSLVSLAQCPDTVICTGDQFQFVFSTVPNSGNVDEVDVKLPGGGSAITLSVDSVSGDTIFTEKSTLSCSDTASSLQYRYNNANVGTKCNDDTPLPVDFISVNAISLDDRIEINFSTAMELNNSHFEIEKYINGEFVLIAMQSGAGTTNEIQSYTVYDDSPLEGNNIYRVKQVDFDGEYDYSDLFRTYSEFKHEKVRYIVTPTGVTIDGFDVLGRSTRQ